MGEIQSIGFIGVGIMGKSMVRNLMKAGFDLHIYARTRSKVEDVIGEGAVFHESIADCVKDRDAVITIVGFPQDVEEVYFDEGNILDHVKEGAYLIDTFFSDFVIFQIVKWIFLSFHDFQFSCHIPRTTSGHF